MDDSLYSSSYRLIKFDGSESSELVKALSELAEIFPNQTIRTHHWNEHHIAVPVKVSVNLPSRGPVNDVDIREEEPVILVFHRHLYPYRSPLVFSDRRDFPRDRLPHLNPIDQSHPISFCLYRGNVHDWMAERTIFELIVRIRQWFCDAARNRLIPPGDGWEALRIDNAIGITIFSPEKIQNYIQEQWNFTQGKGGFSILRYRMCPHESSDPMTSGQGYAIELLDVVEAKKAQAAIKQIRQLNEQHYSNPLAERQLLGILLWPARDNICNRYFVDIPKNLEDLLEWEPSLGLAISKPLQLYENNGYRLFGGSPITLALRRPTNLLGKSSDIELLNLVISSSQPIIANNLWSEEARILTLAHRTPLVTRTAREISQAQELEDKKLLVFGCGAVGSKVVMHLARSGCTKLVLVDDDTLSPHNLVRHALLSNSVGKNKAAALAEEITALFREKLQVEAIETNGINLLVAQGKKLLRAHDWLVDTTASASFLRAVVDQNLPDNIRVIRAELAHKGQIGILSAEGDSRNPRLDDIYASLLDLACENKFLSAWLQEEQNVQNNELRFEEVAIGIGCSTDTMRLADDVISFHSSVFSLGLSKQLRHPSSNGYLQISFLSQEDGVSEIRRVIPKFYVIRAYNDQTWEIRIAENAKQEIADLVGQSGHNETGGILIGRVNSLRKTIHVTKSLPPPSDSKSSPYMFVRGIADVWDSVKQIKTSTGDFIYYVGEWHSHPMGGEQLSETDKRTARELQNVLRTTGIPTHILIATPSQLVPHVYSGNSTI